MLRRALGVAVVASVVFGLGVPAAASHAAATAPVIVGWNVFGGPADCSCIDFDVILNADAPTVMRVEWGQTTALGAVAGNSLVPIGRFTLRWDARPAPGTYYFRLVAENEAGTTATGLLGLTINPDGTVRTFPPPAPPRPPGPAASRVTLTVQTAPVSVVVGDSVDFQAQVASNSTWSAVVPAGVSFVLPGLSGVCTGCTDAAVEVVSVTPSMGTCRDLVSCSFSQLGPNGQATVTLRLRAKTPGDYRLVVQASPSIVPAVTIAFTIVARVADLGVQPVPPASWVKVGRTITRTVTIENHGPHAVRDAILIVGAPRLVSVRASIGNVQCAPVPIRCALPELDSGQAVAVTIVATAKRAGRTVVPIGVASQAAGDASTANNTAPLSIRVVSRKTAKKK